MAGFVISPKISAIYTTIHRKDVVARLTTVTPSTAETSKSDWRNSSSWRANKEIHAMWKQVPLMEKVYMAIRWCETQAAKESEDICTDFPSIPPIPSDEIATCCAQCIRLQQFTRMISNWQQLTSGQQRYIFKQWAETARRDLHDKMVKEMQAEIEALRKNDLQEMAEEIHEFEARDLEDDDE